jgi:hypothetical protein
MISVESTLDIERHRLAKPFSWGVAEDHDLQRGRHGIRVTRKIPQGSGLSCWVLELNHDANVKYRTGLESDVDTAFRLPLLESELALPRLIPRNVGFDAPSSRRQVGDGVIPLGVERHCSVGEQLERVTTRTPRPIAARA